MIIIQTYWYLEDHIVLNYFKKSHMLLKYQTISHLDRASSFILQQDKVCCKQKDSFPIFHLVNCKNKCVFHPWHYLTQIQFFTVMLCTALQITVNCQVKKKKSEFYVAVESILIYLIHINSSV